MKIHKNHQYQIWGLIFFTAFCGASVAVFGKIALQGLHPFSVIFIRFLCATIFLLPFIHKRKEISLAHLKQFSSVALFGALNPILFLIALQFTTASASPFIFTGIPVLAVLYAYFLDHVVPNVRQIAGIVLGLIGVGVIVLLPLLEKNVPENMLLGNVLIIFAMISFSLYARKSKKAQDEFGASAISLVFYFCIVALVFSIPFAVFEVQKFGLHAVQPTHLMGAVVTGLLGTVLNYLSYQLLLKKSSTAVAGAGSFLQPVITVVMASVLLQEVITPTLIFGGSLAIIGALLASFHKKIYENSAAS